MADSSPPYRVFLPTVARLTFPMFPETNLLTNGTFEAGSLHGWQAAGATLISGGAHTGHFGVRLENSAELRGHIATLPGQVYKVVAWLKIVSESGEDWGGFRLSVHGRDWAILEQSDRLIQSEVGGEWFKVALQFTAEQDSTPLVAGYFGGPGRRLVVLIDDVYAFPKSPNRPPEFAASLAPTTIAALPLNQGFRLLADDVDGAVTRVLWEFGDGGRAVAWSGQRRASMPGHFVARVTVADDEGATATRLISWTASDSRYPDLAVSHPSAPETVVSAPELALRGSAGNAASVVVSSDRGDVVPASGVADWSADVTLHPGWNRLLVQARGHDGRLATLERRVRYEPAGPLDFTLLGSSGTTERWSTFEGRFRLDNSAATSVQLPYQADMPPGLGWVDGVTVEGLFTPDNWATVYRRPAFFFEPYQRVLKDDQEWLYPAGEPEWLVRFAPPSAGQWKYRLQVTEAQGTAQSPEYAFSVVESTSSENHGPVRVAPNDNRYFEFADGTPFLGAGHAAGYSAERFAYDALDEFNLIGPGNQNFFRLWVGGRLWGSAWQPWRSRTLNNDGYVPATGLTLDHAYGNGLVALRLDAANPIMFQGFDSGRAALRPGRKYRLIVRWRTENVSGPANPAWPYGATVKFTAWPEVGQTHTFPAVIPHVGGDTPWHVAYTDFVAGGDFLDNLAVVLENTTGGAAYVDEVRLHEVLADGSLGRQQLPGPRFNSHLAFDPWRGASMEALLAEAEGRGVYYRLVISEKDEFIINRLGPDGLPEPLGRQFDAGAGTPGRWLHQAYWRHLMARFGSYRSVHSWELVNEAAPEPGDHFQLAAELAVRAAADGNPHLAATSTWATLAEAAWKDPASAPLSHADFHAYVRGSGWIEPRSELVDDSARFFHEYDLAALAAGFNKPVIWGEQGIDSGWTTDAEEPLLAADVNGVWLHKMIWARCGSGGVYPLYWYTDNIFGHSLHHLYGAWARFMAGIPLTNGRYHDLAATVSNPQLRVLGQKDLQAGWAHAWIDNRQHTWRAVVDGASVVPVSGSVALALQRPNAAYTVTWYDTSTGLPARSHVAAANASGVLTVAVTQLLTDTAVRIELVDN